MSNTKRGAPAAYRGYRLQALYILYRLLKEKDFYTIAPEKLEDMSILNTNGEPLEIIQIKAYSSKSLGYADLKSSTDSVFKRFLKYKNAENQPKLIILSFDPVGPELLNGFTGGLRERGQLERKLSEDGFTSEEIEYIFRLTHIQQVNEEEIKELVDSLLQILPSGSSLQASFDLLNFWLYDCSENELKITKQDLMGKLLSVSRDINAEFSFQQHWYRTIIPLQQMNESNIREDAFYQGTLTTYQHIAMGYDVGREEWIDKLRMAHSQNNIVILHGPSGQGKTTLAYRYMHDHFPNNFRFEIKTLQDQDTALQVAQALSGLASRTQVPLGIYLDISPREHNWVSLIRELSNLPHVFILVTIREEDWKRAYLYTYDLTFTDLLIEFSKDEAQQYYKHAIIKLGKSDFLEFEDAWISFGSKGPFMEFSYFVFHDGITLREKLKRQLLRIENECRETQNYNALRLLKLVSVATAFNCRLKLADLAKELSLESIFDIDLLEGEYLVRINRETNVLEGLHQVRSVLMAEMLIDEQITHWFDLAKVCIRIMPEDDIETFLTHAFRENKLLKLVDFLCDPRSFSVKTWTGVNGVMQSLLWAGVYEYYLSNEHLIDEIRLKLSGGWSLILGDVAGASPDRDAFREILSLLNVDEQRLREIELLSARQTDRNNIYMYAQRWLISIADDLYDPESLLQWKDLSNVAYWSGRLSKETMIFEYICNVNFEQLLTFKAQIRSVSEVIYGLYESQSIVFHKWYDQRLYELIDSFRKEFNIIRLQNDENEIHLTTLFKLHMETGTEELDNHIHTRTMTHIDVASKLLPNKQFYNHQGVGHRILQLLDIPDESVKHIPKDNLFPDKLTLLNSLFYTLADFDHRPENWQTFYDQVMLMRREVVSFFKSINDLLIRYHLSNNTITLASEVLKLEWTQVNKILNEKLFLPKSLVDRFGGLDERSIRKTKTDKLQLHSIHLQKYTPLFKEINSFAHEVSNFLAQAKNILHYHCSMVKTRLTDDQKAFFNNIYDQQGYIPKNKWISYSILKDVNNYSFSMQREFEAIFHGSKFHGYGENEEDFLKTERNTIQHTLSFWHAMLSNERNLYVQPAIDIIHEHEQIIKSLNDRLIEGLQEIEKHSDGKVAFETREVSGLLIIEFNVDHNILDVYSFFNETTLKLLNLFEEISFNDVAYNQIERLWNRFIMVPFFKGEFVLDWYWEIPYFSVIGHKDIKPLYQIPKTLNSDLKNTWLLFACDRIDTEKSRVLVSSFGSLLVFIKHLSDIVSISDTDEIGVQILKDYLLKLNPEISKEYQMIINILTDFLEEVNIVLSNANSEELLQMAFLIFEEIKNIMSMLSLKESGDGHISIVLGEMEEYALKLDGISLNVLVAALLWIELQSQKNLDLTNQSLSMDI